MTRDALVASICGFVVVFMVGASDAAVPFYDWFCRATGFNGTTQVATSAPSDAPLARKIAVRFDANVGPGLPWKFEPEQNEIEVRIGEVVTVFYTVTNQAARATAGVAAYNVAPLTVGAYFQKINCFCFTEQIMGPGEKREMPVVFYVDPAAGERQRERRTEYDYAILYLLSRARDRAEAAWRPARATSARETCDTQRFPLSGISRLSLRRICAEGNGTPNGETAMATAHAKHHDYHLVDPSPWPVVGSISAFIMAVGAITWMHHMFAAAPVIFGVGTIGVLYTMASWWGDVIREAQYKGDHTRVVQISHRYGMILFIASEVMFFVAWFWAFFNSALFPADAVHATRDAVFGCGPGTAMGACSVPGTWPPKGIETFDPWHLPLLNTLLLLTSGTTVTWAHHALLENDRQGLKYGLILTGCRGRLHLRAGL